MVDVFYDDAFDRFLNKVKDQSLKDQIRKLVKKIISDPELGKPMMHERKGTREVYLRHYRLSYAYLPSENRLIFLDIYHKDEQ